MNIRFASVTEFSGPSGKVKAHLENLQENNIDYITARSDFNGRAVALGGADTDRFMKETYNIELPEELKGKSKAEAGAIIAANPSKYESFIEQLMEAASDVFGFIDNVFAYADARKAEGQDTEGNPIQQQEIQ